MAQAARRALEGVPETAPARLGSSAKSPATRPRPYEDPSGARWASADPSGARWASTDPSGARWASTVGGDDADRASEATAIRAPSTPRPATPGFQRRSLEKTTLRAAVVVGAVVVVLVAVVVGLTTTHHGSGSRAPVTSPAANGARASRSDSGATSQSTIASPPGTSASSAPALAPSSASGSAAAAGTTGAPQLSSIDPSQGSTGQNVVITGANLFSPDGHVQVWFGTQPATTSCPVQTSCNVTVPAAPPGASGPVAVTVTTASGASSALSFVYQ